MEWNKEIDPVTQQETVSIRWYLYDGLGSVLAEIGEIDGNDNVVKCTRTYNAFGSVLSSTGDQEGNNSFVGALGHTQESSTGGLIYMRARWYDPSMGRFISEDPARDGVNWYAYCNNNPVNKIDASGRLPAWVAVIAQVVAAMAAYTGGYALGYYATVWLIRKHEGEDWEASGPDWFSVIVGSGASGGFTGVLKIPHNLKWRTLAMRCATPFAIAFVVGVVVGAHDAYVEYATADALGQPRPEAEIWASD